MSKFLALLACCVLLSSGAPSLWAQEADSPPDPAVGAAPTAGMLEEEEIAITGSRRAPRSVYESMSPVDLISAEDFRQQSSSNMLELLRRSIPALNVNTQPISDGATMVRPISLRGFSSDHVLILVNNKRRHRGSVIGWLTPGVSRGSQGPDLAAIPAIAIKRVEVLHSGATAQYGSDAISGVINFILDDSNANARVEFDSGIYGEGDGASWSVAGNLGLPMPFLDVGFINLSLEIGGSEETDRSVQRGDARELRTAGNVNVDDPAQIWGSPEVWDEVKLFVNTAGEIVPGSVELYAFGNFNHRSTDGGFYFRNPNDRATVFTTPSGRKDASGDDILPYRLVGDLTDDGVDDCASFRTVDPVKKFDDDAVLGALISNPNCFVYNEWFPGGFTPRFGGDTIDYAFAGGVRGEFGKLRWDLSAGFGANKNDFVIRNTVNASLGPWTSRTNWGANSGLKYAEDFDRNIQDVPEFFAVANIVSGTTGLEYDVGAYNQYERRVNLDVSYPLKVPVLASELHIAGGLEWREEEFQIVAGEVASWYRGPLADQGFSAGTNGFPGFSPDTAGEWTSANTAIYVDLEADILENWTVGGTLRWDDYDEFDDTLKGRLTTRVAITEGFSLRGTYSAGFHMPTPGQLNAINATSRNVANVTSVVATIPATNAVAVRSGGRALVPEESESIALGFALKHRNLAVSVDCFQVRVWERLALSKEIGLTDADRAGLVRAGLSSAGSWDYFTFFTNAFTTDTRGCDLVASYDLAWRAGQSNLTVAWSRAVTDVSHFVEDGPLDSEDRIRDIENGVPHNRAVITFTHSYERWNFLLRYSMYDAWYDTEEKVSLERDGETVDVGYYFNGYGVLDVLAGYSFPWGLEVTAGLDNVLHVYPEENPFRRRLGAQYSQYSPGDFNGIYGYFRVSFDFF